MYRYCSVSPCEGKCIHLYRDTSTSIHPIFDVLIGLMYQLYREGRRSPGVAWMHKYPWIQVQYLFLGCMCNTIECAILGNPLYAYPQYQLWTCMCNTCDSITYCTVTRTCPDMSGLSRLSRHIWTYPRRFRCLKSFPPSYLLKTAASSATRPRYPPPVGLTRALR